MHEFQEGLEKSWAGASSVSRVQTLHHNCHYIYIYIATSWRSHGTFSEFAGLGHVETSCRGPLAV